MTNHTLWVEKYRPKSVSEFKFHNERQRQVVLSMIEKQSISHLLLHGVQGSGKTALSMILAREVGVDESDVLTINGSDDNSIEYVRDTIKGFISTYAMNKFKIVRLEEADGLSPHAQKALRAMMEDYSENARFILTCNYPHKIIPAIRSRVPAIEFVAMDEWDVVEYCATILATEQVAFQLDVLQQYVTAHHPDVRAVVNNLQLNTIDGKLLPFSQGSGTQDWLHALPGLMDRDKWVDIRKLMCSSVMPEQWEDVYRYLYDNLHTCGKFQDHSKWEEGILIIAKHLHMHALVADSEINAAAMFISLGQA